jgi:hypothetical protein
MEDVGFIVNVALTVLWCGPAVYDVLGWRETDLLDSEVTEYMNGMSALFTFSPFSLIFWCYQRMIKRGFEMSLSGLSLQMNGSMSRFV